MTRIVVTINAHREVMMGAVETLKADILGGVERSQALATYKDTIKSAFTLTRQREAVT